MNDEIFSYDSVPYPSYTFPQTHPDRLATLGRVHGIPTPSPENCRVLEIGCGDGTNLISFAYTLPNSSFVGIDLSEVHITKASETARTVGTRNVEFMKADVCDVGVNTLGKFDYIIAHGLFSWVPDMVRPEILRIYSECLTENGVGYISYNAYPGCRIREITSGIMQFFTNDIEDPAQNVADGISFLDQITNAAEKNSLFQSMLKLELDQIQDRSVSNVFHDDLSQFNKPLYFHEFAKMIAPFGLQFLSESEPTASNIGKLSAEARELLSSVSGDILKFEQYLDFVTCRRFRTTLVCRNGKQIDRNDFASRLDDLYISSQIDCDESDPVINDDSPVRFVGAKGATLTINHPLTKSVLVRMHAEWPGGLTFDELAEAAEAEYGSSIASKSEKLRTADYLMQMYWGGFIKLGTVDPPFARLAGEFPEVSKFARWQIENGSESVSTLVGKNLEARDEFLRLLMLLLDGTRDRKALGVEMMEFVQVPEHEHPAFTTQLPNILEEQLEKLAAAGLLLT